MAISYSGEGYKFQPQFANLGALQGLQPLDVTRKAEFNLQPLTYAPIQSSRPELVSEGISKGILAAVGGITEGITAKYKTEQAKEEKLAERAHDLKVAALKAKQYDPYIEALKTKKLELETDAIDKRIEGSVPAGAKRRIYRSIDTEPLQEPLPESTETTDDKIDFNLTPSGAETVSMRESDMSANIADQAKALEGISAEYLTASTDSGVGPFAPIEQPKSMQLGKVSTSLISPEQEKEIQSKFEPYGIPSVLEKTPPKTLLSIEKAQPKEEVKIQMPESGDVDTEEQAQQMAYRDIPGFKQGKYTQEVDENGNPFFRVEPREKMSRSEIAAEKKAEAEAKKAELEGTQGKKEKLQQFQLQSFENVNRAQETLADLEKHLEKVQGKLGPVSGRLLSKNPYDPDVQLLQKYLTALVPTIARGVYGEVGVLTQADIDNYKQLIPNITQDPANAKATLEFLKRDLDRAKKTKLGIWESTNFDVEGLKKFNQVSEIAEKTPQDQISTLSMELEQVPVDQRNSPDFLAKRKVLFDLVKQQEELKKKSQPKPTPTTTPVPQPTFQPAVPRQSATQYGETLESFLGNR
jgi:hypothetical protein